MANFNFNKVILGGRLVADPELRTTTTGVSVASFRIAVNRQVARDEERKADFFDCVAWRSTGEFIQRYFHKGNSIVIEGKTQFRSFQAKDGTMKTVAEIVVDQAYFVDGKDEQKPKPYDPEMPRALIPEDAKLEEVAADEELPF